MRALTVVAVAVLVLGVAGLFVVDAGSAPEEPADFDRTVSMGLTYDQEFGLDDDVVLPRTQVYYSQYRYVVGYYGVETFLEDRRGEGHEQRFGYPLAIYVTDFSGAEPTLTEAGHTRVDAEPGWTDATEAAYVVGSDARTPAGETVVPFSERSDADAFAAEYGGTVLGWEALLAERFEVDDADVVRDRVGDQHAAADAFVADSQAALDRPVSVVVGDAEAADPVDADEGDYADSDADGDGRAEGDDHAGGDDPPVERVDTIAEAVATAPANTTVVVAGGHHDERIEIDRPITLAGDDGATVDGGGNGSPIAVSAPGAAVTELRIVGVGNESGDVDPLDLDHHVDPDEVDEEEWEADLLAAYARGDAGIEADGADGLLVENVTVETPANGVIARGSPGLVVRNLTVYGADSWRDGYMGVVVANGDGVIEGSTFYDGRDAVYTHRADGLVVRENTMRGNRMGVHFMHTSDALIADNYVRDQGSTGIYIMTGPTRNAVVGNDVFENPIGIRPEGTDSYVADNVVAGNELGLRAEASNSIYEGNVVVGNLEGFQARTMLPSNRIVGNDFVDNRRHVTSGPFTPLRIWSHDGVGNHWDGAIGDSTGAIDDRDGAVLDRPYSPTHAVDGRLHELDGTPALARAPALDAVAGLQGTVPGMRAGEVVDPAPLCDPNRPTEIERIGWEVEERCDLRPPEP